MSVARGAHMKNKKREKAQMARGQASQIRQQLGLPKPKHHGGDTEKQQ